MKKTCDLCGEEKEGYEADGDFFCMDCLKTVLPEQYDTDNYDID
jgi:hypothetical protein